MKPVSPFSCRNGNKPQAWAFFRLTVFLVIFLLYCSPALAAKKENSYQNIEAALIDSRGGFSATLKDVEERIATLKKIELERMKPKKGS